MVTQVEQKLCEWLLNMTGSFYTKLIEAMMIADHENRKQLALGYPQLMEAVERYKDQAAYYEDLATRWNDINPNHRLHLDLTEFKPEYRPDIKTFPT